MATMTSVTLEDDLEGRPADETARFALGGAEYDSDLSRKNATVFRKQLAPFAERARRAGPGSRRPARTAPERERGGAILVRAKDQGIAVSDRGRIPGSVVERYQAATRGLWSAPDHGRYVDPALATTLAREAPGVGRNLAGRDASDRASAAVRALIERFSEGHPPN